MVELVKPKMVLLENVKNLTHKRALDSGEAPTDIIKNDLAKLGYASRFCLVDTFEFGLPQHRVRVYLVALRGDCDVAPIFRSLASLRTAPQALSASSVLDSQLPAAGCEGRVRAVQRRGGEAWRDLERPFIEQHAQYFDRHLPRVMLRELRTHIHFRALTERAQRALAIMYCVAQRVYHIDPRLTLCVFDCSQSLGRIPWEVEASPCVCPRSVLWVSCCPAGPHAASAMEFLRLQGVSDHEVLLHKLKETELPLLRDLAGNSFSAQVVAAVLLAMLANFRA